jgi:DNA (cytosine-5)-methyltransferase 1
MTDLRAIDLFSGAGGLSWGLQDAGFNVLFGSDIDKASAATYSRNHPCAEFYTGDITALKGEAILAATGLRPGELDLLAGGPPCQGFSIIGSRQNDDPRNDLFRHFIRIATELRPKVILIENVPGLATLNGGKAVTAISEAFSAAGYSCEFAELLAAQYGVPQMRWRMVFIGFRLDLAIPPGSGFPAPTHGKRGIGELIPNCAISADDSAGFLTTFDAIADLPSVQAGAQVDRYSDGPSTPYQRRMRQSAGNELHNHYAPKLSKQNLDRIKFLSPGQNWRDLPIELLPDGMKKALRKDHTRRYSRMTWEGVPRSIITRFRDPKSGEYSHPAQIRTISIREAARIQSFPDRFIFCGSNTEQYNQVGNAVPPILAEAIGRELAACLRGETTFKMSNQFSRRPALRQRQLMLA